jgi:peptidoglycan/xylan/chitin deacetylase (PgdA/CDA1 family)
MLHRFSCPDRQVVGHSPAAVRKALGRLRKQRYDLISLHEMFRRLKAGEDLSRAVAFTIDDGYFDHAAIGGAIFAEFDCPATIFAVTGFLDGEIWLWWDKIRHVFENTRKSRFTLQMGAETATYVVDSNETRALAQLSVAEWCQDASEADRSACIEDLCRLADVELPAKAPPQFSPLSWDEARSLEKRGVTFGPHTISHPVLSSTSDERSDVEITSSWSRLREEVTLPVPVFCYPHGRRRDFGDREMATVQRLGLLGAVQGAPGRLRIEEFREPSRLCMVPRFPFSDELADVLQCVSGLEALKGRLRGAPGF